MEKFKKLFKSANKFGLLAILLVGIFVFTQSAFKASKVDDTTEYVLIPGTGWQPKGSLHYGNEEGDYNCNESMETTCSGFFNNDNLPTSPVDQPIPVGKRLGEFYIVGD